MITAAGAPHTICTWNLFFFSVENGKNNGNVQRPGTVRGSNVCGGGIMTAGKERERGERGEREEREKKERENTNLLIERCITPCIFEGLQLLLLRANARILLFQH